MCHKAETPQGAEDLKEKVVLAFTAMHVQQPSGLKKLSQCGSGFRKVVVWDLGKEEVVHEVAVGDVMVQRVKGKAICVPHSTARECVSGKLCRESSNKATALTFSVDGLEGTLEVGPCVVIEHERVLIMMLQVRDSDEPKAEHKPAAAIAATYPVVCVCVAHTKREE